MNRIPGIHCGKKLPIRQNFIFAFAALVLGAGIYVFLRPVMPVFFQWNTFFRLYERLDPIRKLSLSLASFLPEQIIYSLPQGLWAFAYTLIIKSIWGRHKSIEANLWTLSVPLLILGFEGLQYVGAIPGTFCLYDVFYGLAGICVGMITGKRLRPELSDRTMQKSIL